MSPQLAVDPLAVLLEQGERLRLGDPPGLHEQPIAVPMTRLVATASRSRSS
jgi:hypothetical protein